MYIRRFALIVLSLLWAATLCLAQLDTASILGTVLDSSGGVIPGAKVVVQNMGTSATVELTSDQNGNFIAPVLPIGKYKVTVSVTNFNTFVQEGIQLNVADRVQLFITLKPGVVTQQVTVVGETPVVETASTTIGAVVSQQQVVDLPLNGRAVDTLVSLAPGVVSLGPHKSMSGASTGERDFDSGHKFLLDGGDSSGIDSDNADGGYGSAGRVNRISVDAVAEFRLAEMYSAEYGQTIGAVVNFISKSGTNQLHGSLYEFFRNEKLDARDWFNPEPFIKPAFRLNQYGGTLGGPIKKDKLFFFVDYEGDRQRLGRTFDTFVPTEEFRATLPAVLQPVVAQLPLPNGPVSADEPRIAAYNGSRVNQLREDTWMAKIDYQPTAKDRLTFRYNYNKAFTKVYFGVGEAQYEPIPSLMQTSKISYTRTLTPTMLNEAGFFFDRMHVVNPGAGTEAVRDFPIVVLGSGVPNVGPFIFDMDTPNTLFTYMDTLSWVKGRHQMKFGAQFLRMQCSKAVRFQQYILFPSLDWFQYNVPYGIWTVGWPRPGVRMTYRNFFVQDDIQATPNLTINAGLRYQYDGSPTEVHGQIANFDLATATLDPPGTPIFKAPKLNLAPRIGLAYTPFGSKKTVIRVGFGMFYNSYNASFGSVLTTNVPGRSMSANVTIFDDPYLVGFPTPDISAYVNSRSPAAESKDWAESYTEQWSFNVQRGFGESMVFQVGYVGNRALHLASSAREANPIISGTGIRRYPNFGSIAFSDPSKNSTYNALQVSFKRRMSRRLTFNVNYTWSHNLDQGGDVFGVAPAA